MCVCVNGWATGLELKRDQGRRHSLFILDGCDDREERLLGAVCVRVCVCVALLKVKTLHSLQLLESDRASERRPVGEGLAVLMSQ